MKPKQKNVRDLLGEIQRQAADGKKLLEQLARLERVLDQIAETLEELRMELKRSTEGK
jgi:hypothetical protein